MVCGDNKYPRPWCVVGSQEEPRERLLVAVLVHVQNKTIAFHRSPPPSTKMFKFDFDIEDADEVLGEASSAIPQKKSDKKAIDTQAFAEIPISQLVRAASCHVSIP